MVSHLQWLPALKEEPLDRNGPVEIPFEPFESPWITIPICERFDQIAARHFDKVAVDDGDSSLTFGEIQRASLVLACNIEAHVPSGRPIGILLKRSVFFLIAALACLRVGRPIIPIDHDHPKERNALIGREANLAAVIFDGDGVDAKDLFEGLPWLDVIGTLGVLPDRMLKAAPADGVAFILYTSGSSGQPKGICNNQSAILQRVAQFTNACHLNAEDRFLLMSSTGSIAGIRDIFSAALNGATLVIAEPNKVGLDGILRAMDRGRITICYALPALLRSLLTLRGAQSAFRDVRILRLGGDIVRKSDIALCRSTVSPMCHILIGYGSTEAPTLFQWFIPRDWSGDGSPVPCGRLMPDTSVALVNDMGMSVATGEVGELIVRSQYLALGLWQHGRLDRGIFEGEHALSFLRTGDLLRLRHDGLAELVGRTGRMVKILGQRVDPAEIEAVLRSNKEVEEAVVIVRKNGISASSLDAFVTCLSDPPRISDLRTMMSQRLPVHMRPSRILFIEAIPLLAGFKPDIVALTNWNFAAGSPLVLEALNPDRLLVVVPPPVDDHARKAVEKAWSNLLDRSSFERNDAWAEAGGDSLKAMELIFFIEETLNVSLPPEVFDQTTTPKALIDAINRLPRGSSVREDSLKRGDELRLPLVFLMPGIGGDEPALARMRMDLKMRVRFVTTKYPSLSEMCAAEGRFDAMVEAVVQQIRLVAKSDEVIHLAGYSFGGFVAWEVASNLITRGYRVGAIELIDTRRSRVLSDLDRQLTRSTKFSTANIVDQTWQSATKILHSANRWLRLCLPLKVVQRLYKTEQGFDFWLKGRALDNLTLSKLDHPAVLFRSTEFIRVSPDYGWSNVCSQLTIVPIGGTHYTMLDSPLRQILAERLLKTVSEAEAAAAIPHRHAS
jgi:acyl-coenzyme A synthetase/AMP-(fatty) acid ligase/thioesterase domain-containing protein/acyl carrier protein